MLKHQVLVMCISSNLFECFLSSVAGELLRAILDGYGGHCVSGFNVGVGDRSFRGHMFYQRRFTRNLRAAFSSARFFDVPFHPSIHPPIRESLRSRGFYRARPCARVAGDSTRALSYRDISPLYFSAPPFSAFGTTTSFGIAPGVLSSPCASKSLVSEST